MKKAILGLLVNRIGGTTFDDGGQVVKVTCEDGYSFNVNPAAPLLKKIDEGYELDITYTGDKENETTNQSGGKFTFHNLTGVKVFAARPGVIDEALKDLPDIDRAQRPIIFKAVGGGTSSANPGGGEAPRV